MKYIYIYENKMCIDDNCIIIWHDYDGLGW